MTQYTEEQKAQLIQEVAIFVAERPIPWANCLRDALEVEMENFKYRPDKTPGPEDD